MAKKKAPKVVSGKGAKLKNKRINLMKLSDGNFHIDITGLFDHKLIDPVRNAPPVEFHILDRNFNGKFKGVCSMRLSEESLKYISMMYETLIMEEKGEASMTWVKTDCEIDYIEHTLEIPKKKKKK